MTSTSFNIGLADGRNSSRVLRPPGGGHTPLFGPADPEPPKKDHGRNASSITEGRSEPKVPTPTAEQPPQQKTPTAEPSAAPAAPQAAAADPAPAQRSRVPPGGFSSGLW
ncbi:jupiter microtubule associated homolog 1 [Aethina tumida]|uniref:jupiter microtubule associated homolog 1 n=1 Tax=Aethina tumida TaxID=116153 RepID=UPI00096B5C57|nr:jupiter microtubule associated homolog 1 [Aethina tumida]